LSKQSAALLAAHDFFISCLFMALRLLLWPRIVVGAATWVQSLFSPGHRQIPQRRHCLLIYLIPMNQFWVWDKIKTCSLFHWVTLLRFIFRCLSNYFSLSSACTIIYFFGVVILAFCDWQITYGSIGSCSNISPSLHRDSFIHLSCVATVAFPDRGNWSHSPRWNFVPWCGNTSSLLIFSGAACWKANFRIDEALKSIIRCARAMQW